MNYNAAAAWVAAMNAANYLGHNNWQLPTTAIFVASRFHSAPHFRFLLDLRGHLTISSR
jgi:hypothetical protein